jgi:hypothetical protein
VSFNFLGIISFVADFLPLLLLLLNLNLLKQKTFLVLFGWTVVSFGLDISIYLSSKADQQVIAFLAIPLEAIFVCVLYYTIAKNKYIKYFLLVALVAFLAYMIKELYDYKIVGFQYWLASIAIIFTLLLSSLVFFDIFKASKEGTFLLNNNRIWLIFAYMIYAAGNLFLFATTEEFPNIFADPGLWTIFIIANVLKNLFFVKAIIQARNSSIADS